MLPVLSLKKWERPSVVNRHGHEETPERSGSFHECKSRVLAAAVVG